MVIQTTDDDKTFMDLNINQALCSLKFNSTNADAILLSTSDKTFAFSLQNCTVMDITDYTVMDSTNSTSDKEKQH